jgi:hydrogenase expression/formation protein HypC
MTEQVCVTCSDQALPAVIVALLADKLALARVEVCGGTPGESVTEEISVALVDVDVGDTVLVHAKEALVRVGSPHGGSAPPARGGSAPPARGERDPGAE